MYLNNALGLGLTLTENSNKGNIPLQQGVVLSKKDCPSTEEQREYMSKVPYASAIGSIMYAMLCTRVDVVEPKWFTM